MRQLIEVHLHPLWKTSLDSNRTSLVRQPIKTNFIGSDWFTASTHSVPREPGRSGTAISGVCADAGK
jgi:hypothetical protein